MEELNALELYIDDKFNDILGELYDSRDIKNGDITPMQSFEWDELVHSTAILFLELMKQNA